MPEQNSAETAAIRPATAFTSRAWLLLTAYLAFVTSVPCLYALSQRVPPPVFQVMAWFGSGLAFAHLVRRDSALLGLRGSIPDFSVLILVAWPVVVPYHFFSTRGRAGWRPFSIFIAIYLGTSALYAVLTVAAWALNGQL